MLLFGQVFLSCLALTQAQIEEVEVPSAVIWLFKKTLFQTRCDTC